MIVGSKSFDGERDRTCDPALHALKQVMERGEYDVRHGREQAH